MLVYSNMSNTAPYLTGEKKLSHIEIKLEYEVVRLQKNWLYELEKTRGSSNGRENPNRIENRDVREMR